VPNATISLINDLAAVTTVGLYYINIMLQLLTSRDFISNLSPSSLQKYVINVLGAKCVYEYNKKLNLDDWFSLGIFCKTKLYTRSRTHGTRDIELLHFQIYVSMFYLISNVLSCIKSKLTLASINFVSFTYKDMCTRLCVPAQQTCQNVHWIWFTGTKTKQCYLF